jgi:hypothetical protein
MNTVLWVLGANYIIRKYKNYIILFLIIEIKKEVLSEKESCYRKSIAINKNY